MKENGPVPVNIRLRKQTRALTVEFDNGESYAMSAEFLRVHSPSAEVQGHTPESATLVTGKADVAIVAVEPVGRYAVRLVFDDGHDTGLYQWAYLYELGRHQDEKWRDYQSRVAESRQPEIWDG